MNEYEKNNQQEKLGKYFVVSDATINSVLAKQKSTPPDSPERKERIGELLVKSGQLTPEELENALMKQRAHRLSQCSIFSTLSTPELFALSKVFTEVNFPAHETFIMEGEHDPSLFIIASGLVEVFRINNSGGKIPIAKVGSGETIGEMGYFADGIRSSYVCTLKKTYLLQAQYKDMTKYFENAPKVAIAFSGIIQRRKEETEKRMVAAKKQQS
ncbi:hypothetical protein SPBRAN_1277 [uncultured Candidatus Thioglobus sp.]|nr:hypothetical protein SPBRAN_1277 [uncultured Candidatus Thioglobus sp.]